MDMKEEEMAQLFKENVLVYNALKSLNEESDAWEISQKANLPTHTTSLTLTRLENVGAVSSNPVRACLNYRWTQIGTKYSVTDELKPKGLLLQRGVTMRDIHEKSGLDYKTISGYIRRFVDMGVLNEGFHWLTGIKIYCPYDM
jgi:hypothetical protein